MHAREGRALGHAERGEVEVEQGFLLVALVGILGAELAGLLAHPDAAPVRVTDIPLRPTPDGRSVIGKRMRAAA